MKCKLKKKNHAQASQVLSRKLRLCVSSLEEMSIILEVINKPKLLLWYMSALSKHRFSKNTSLKVLSETKSDPNFSKK